ncbi:MAG TPA: alpha/beta fold hydrolase, partial [Blastocatellia bacterium]|nr:alpha/beta fold hydrolase [Blastocatellia bacterium]
GHFIPRRFRMVDRRPEPRVFDTAPGVRVLTHCSWQEDRLSKATLILVHGMEGSSESRYMLGTAEKALAAGFSVVRVNYRNCGGTEHLTPTLYHAGLTDDLRQIIHDLIERDGLREIYLIGFSLGGNMVLKLAGEYGASIPSEIRGVVGISASIDLAACADAIELRRNIVYSTRFVLSLRGRLRRKAELFPDRYDPSLLRGVWTIRQFDDAYVAPHCGFRDSADYYERASALRVIDRVRVPTLIIHAKDDPFIPFSQIEQPEVASNPNISVLAPDQGGHVGFISANGEGESRFWAESTVVRFVELISGLDCAARHHSS